MKRDTIIYWVATGLMCALMLMSAGMYIFNHEAILGAFASFGYPTYLIYPLAIAKILGVIAIISKISPFLKGLAYAGFFYDFILAFFAHFMISDGGHITAAIALVLLAVSYYYDRKLFV